MKSTLFYNPKCSKSRKAKEILDQRNINYSLRDYIETPLDRSELTEILSKLGMDASQIVRKKESLIEEQNLDISSAEKCESALLDHPKLLERPIFVQDKKAIVARPPELIEDFLNKN